MDRRVIMVATGSCSKSYQLSLMWFFSGTVLLFLAACQPTGMTNWQPPASASVSLPGNANNTGLSTGVVIRPLGNGPLSSPIKKIPYQRHKVELLVVLHSEMRLAQYRQCLPHLKIRWLQR